MGIPFTNNLGGKAFVTHLNHYLIQWIFKYNGLPFIVLGQRLIYIDIYQSYTSLQPVKEWRSWLRHGTKSRKFARSITDGIIRTFYSHNPSASYN